MNIKTKFDIGEIVNYKDEEADIDGQFKIFDIEIEIYEKGADFKYSVKNDESFYSSVKEKYLSKVEGKTNMITAERECFDDAIQDVKDTISEFMEHDFLLQQARVLEDLIKQHRKAMSELIVIGPGISTDKIRRLNNSLDAIIDVHGSISREKDETFNFMYKERE